MALSMSNLKKKVQEGPPSIVVYGLHGVGKTSLAAQFPAPVFAFVGERPPVGVEPDAWDVASYSDLLDVIATLYNDEHQFGTFVLDSLDKLEPLVQAETCRVNNWKHLEQPGFGKGYAMCDQQWREVFDGLNALRRDKGMCIVLIAHAEVVTFDDPSSVSYSKWDMRLHKRARAIVQDDVDAIFFIGQDAAITEEEKGRDKTRAVASKNGTTFIHAKPAPIYNAKNRMGIPARVPYVEGKGYAALEPYLVRG